MRLVSYGLPGAWKPAIDLVDTVADTQMTARLAGWPDLQVKALTSNRALLEYPLEQILELGDVARQQQEPLRAAGGLFALSSLKLGPPVTDPEKIICIGLNYHDHAEEVGAPPPPSPIFFAKFNNSLCGPEDVLVPPKGSQKVDYEGELAVVIGKPGRYIAPEDALDHVAGAMVMNDVSERDLQLANQLWTSGKAIDTFAPCGPALVLLNALGDIQNLDVKTRVDGETLQDGNTKSMIFDIPALIAFLSNIMTLKPGDIIVTGTPAGVAGAHSPPRFLQPGQTVEVEIEKIGTIKNRIAATHEGSGS